MNLNKLEHFASVAPKMPKWFNPEYPKYDIPPMPDFESIKDPLDRGECSAWLSDGIVDLPEHLSWFGEAVNKHREEKEKRDIFRREWRYFEWRKYYAQKIIEVLDPQSYFRQSSITK